MRFFCHKPKLLDFDYATQYIAAFIVSVGLLLEGMHYGWSSTSIPKILHEDSSYHITLEESGYITQMFTYGSIAYTVISFADYPKLNQKSGVVLSVIVMTISWILIATSNSATLLMIARFLAGTGRGVAYQISLNYICEIAHPKFRGFLASFVFIMTNVGLFLMFAIGPFVEIKYFSIFGIFVALSELIAIKWVPESPYILLLRGKTMHARKVLRSLRSLWNVEDELDQMSVIVKIQDDENYNFWSVFTVQSNLKALFIMIIFEALQNLVGINISIHEILKLSGGNGHSYTIAVIIQMGCVITCIISGCLLDYVGRRSILMLSFAASGTCLLILGCFTYAKNKLHADVSTLEFIPTTCLLSFTIMYKMGIGMIPMLMSGELFPMNAKNTASSFCGIFSIAFNFFTINLFYWIKKMYGPHVMYWFCSCNCLLGTLFTYFILIETKGKSLHEIQMELKNT